MLKRDKEILDSLIKFRVLSRDDIIDLHFSHLKHPVTCANKILNRLRLQGHIVANTHHRPYVYFANPSPIKTNSQKIDHYLQIAKFYRDLRSIEKPRVFKIEPKYGGKGTVEPDAFTIWRKAPFFIEIQRSVYSPKIFNDKMNRYEAFYHSNVWMNESWQPKEHKFFPHLWIIGERHYDVGDRPFHVFQSRDVSEFLQTIA